MSGKCNYKISGTFVRDAASFVRAGGFPAVAAEAAGVPAEVFAGWRAKGEGRARNALYRQLTRDVRSAAAQARLKAECEVFGKKPDVWLRHGPGRETTTNPGWTQPVKAAARAVDSSSVLQSPVIHDFLCEVAAACRRDPGLGPILRGLL